MKYLRILPHLPVGDLEAEVAFYVTIGLHVYLRFDDFTSVEAEDGTLVHFGLRRAAPFTQPEGFEWKLEVDDIHEIYQIALANSLEIVREPVRHWSGKWNMDLRTPNGYLLVLEGMYKAPVQR